MRSEQRAVLLHGAAVWGLKFQHGRGSGQSSLSLTWNGFRSSAPARSPSSRRPSASLSDRCRSDLRRSPVTHAALARPAPQQSDSLYRVQNISGADGLSEAVSRCTNNVLLSLNNLEK
ncbi:hypothetical protein Q7C36_008724 [Tachysurus vachellii]|uniref:Uncharacterized protein n=1 Tax=Tachysurus vachellii TaxID=175792 RepID=A0AA88N6D2_TACVA|nr:hypothetical protein Q7C36_008724 [Tachysurus vachellii]